MKARFALSSSNVFSRTDTTTDSERFYNSLLELLEDPEEVVEVNALIIWWNRWVYLLLCLDTSQTADSFFSQVFPNYTANSRPVSKNSALAKIKAKRAAIKEAALRDT